MRPKRRRAPRINSDGTIYKKPYLSAEVEEEENIDIDNWTKQYLVETKKYTCTIGKYKPPIDQNDNAAECFGITNWVKVMQGMEAQNRQDSSLLLNEIRRYTTYQDDILNRLEKQLEDCSWDTATKVLEEQYRLNKQLRNSYHQLIEPGKRAKYNLDSLRTPVTIEPPRDILDAS